MSAADHCKRVRRLAGLLRREIAVLRGQVRGDELLEAQTHLFQLTACINRAELIPPKNLGGVCRPTQPRRSGASVPACPSVAAAGVTDFKQRQANDKTLLNDE
jgi:hypothetical protein